MLSRLTCRNSNLHSNIFASSLVVPHDYQRTERQSDNKFGIYTVNGTKLSFAFLAYFAVDAHAS